MRRTILLAAAIAATVSTAVMAQPDFNRPPSFGTLNLTAGFTPDPRTVNVTAGGRFDAASIPNANCVGSIANQPDVRVNYTAGTGLPLTFSVASDADTTLAINGPDGSWYCNDDGPNGLNPSITFDSPDSGRYDVYIGHYDAGRSIPARLFISEVGSQ